jgi:hypothetical protein
MGAFSKGGAGTKSCTFEDERVFFRNAGSSVFASHNSSITIMPENKNLLARLLQSIKTIERDRILFPAEEKASLPP